MADIDCSTVLAASHIVQLGVPITDLEDAEPVERSAQ